MSFFNIPTFQIFNTFSLTLTLYPWKTPWSPRESTGALSSRVLGPGGGRAPTHPSGRPQHRPVVPSPSPRSPFSGPSPSRARNEPESEKSAPLSLRLGIALIPHLRPLRKRLLSQKLPRSSFCEKIKRKTQGKPENARFLFPARQKCLWRGRDKASSSTLSTEKTKVFRALCWLLKQPQGLLFALSLELQETTADGKLNSRRFPNKPCALYRPPREGRCPQFQGRKLRTNCLAVPTRLLAAV